LIHRRVNLVLTRGNRKGGGGGKKLKYRRVFFSRYLAANDVWWRLSAIEALPPPRALVAMKLIFLKSIGAVFTEAKKKKKKKKRPNPLVSPCSRLARYSCSYRSGLILLRGALSASLSSAAAACCLFLCGPNLFSHLAAFTETNKQSPNTGARANNTLHK